jgi:hypothetical protein
MSGADGLGATGMVAALPLPPLHPESVKKVVRLNNKKVFKYMILLNIAMQLAVDNRLGHDAHRQDKE